LSIEILLLTLVCKCCTGKVSRLESAAILVASLRLGLINRSARTHSGRVWIGCTRQHMSRCQTWRCAQLGSAWCTRLLSCKQQTVYIRPKSYASKRIYVRYESFNGSPQNCPYYGFHTPKLISLALKIAYWHALL